MRLLDLVDFGPNVENEAVLVEGTLSYRKQVTREFPLLAHWQHSGGLTEYPLSTLLRP